ncbi:MazG nucleotide pyrophosphohydrolase domain-containing protein [Thermococcus sp. Bubb.Bath]|uniref:MazG nucleotide pyrophosphohydrolase domain-containing protein n=1 Tax=Thermococcus sp. Bubb.Bath TaxID=1638242 RepID=UPI001439177F|nr:MazG nucleotide pyrophosphohydrolase domain-containing protein [Thermococcus sp. Bubb.Bath]NJF24659.1 nucleotide pyrophosphohydrolase [Thermococcus sp. Bubb.Bath]
MEIREFQDMIRGIYFHKDSKRGVEKTFLWFVEEVGELSEAIRKRDRESMEEEFADVLAWLASLANLLEIDLEKAARKKYPGVCPYCGKKPCECEEK